MDTPGVIARLDDEPGSQSVVVVLVRRQSELQRIDAVGEVRGAVPVGFEGCVDAARLIVRLSAGMAGELRASKGITRGTPPRHPKRKCSPGPNPGSSDAGGS